MSTERHFEHKSPQFAVNAEFNSFSDMKHACTRAALLDLYEFVPEQVSHTRYRLKCKDKQCSWLFFASTIPGTDVWQVRTSIQSHACNGINGLGHSNLDQEFISIEILPKLRSDMSFTPKAIRNHFKDQYGVEISYSKAYRGRERALNVINGSHEEAYRSLPKYCDENSSFKPWKHSRARDRPRNESVQTLIYLLCRQCDGLCILSPCAWS